MNWPETTKDTTIDEIFEIHRQIWDKVIKDFIEKDIVRKPYTIYRADYALCEYIRIHDIPCSKCPADWGTDEFGRALYCVGNPDYCRYRMGYADESTLEFLKRIRDIPRKKI